MPFESVSQWPIFADSHLDIISASIAKGAYDLGMESVEKAVSVIVRMIPAILFAAFLASCQDADSPKTQQITVEQRESAIESAMELINSRRTVEALAITSTLVKKDSASAESQEIHALALISEGGRLHNIGDLTRAREKQLEALQAYIIACEQSTTPGLLQLSTAQLAHMLKENNTAIQYYKLAHENVPGDSRAAFFLGQIFMLEKKWDEAKIWIAHSLERNRNEPPAILSLALIEAELGNSETAIELARIGCEIQPNDPKLRFIQARVLRITGHHDQAIEILLRLPKVMRKDKLFQDELNACEAQLKAKK
jgi:tetratricopeptide (TPR) repeat protein